jgi:hypothetical protein
MDPYTMAALRAQAQHQEMMQDMMEQRQHRAAMMQMQGVCHHPMCPDARGGMGMDPRQAMMAQMQGGGMGGGMGGDPREAMMARMQGGGMGGGMGGDPREAMMAQMQGGGGDPYGMMQGQGGMGGGMGGDPRELEAMMAERAMGGMGGRMRGPRRRRMRRPGW